ncbi:hypothetical protein CG716_28830 [Mycolicibacterium sphagni]|uniref:Uncharacterized protein n=1 Tax=Mycolicibacterium sphagni TaxID=1786 RepID=A0A255D5T6_9MYCO|nr:hypothetical protein CG716_28830 [Mycolicibacterium sphagni]
MYLAVSLLVIGVLPWRVGKYFSGQLDPVVLGKVGLLLAALLVVLLARGSGESPLRSPPGFRVGLV